MLVKLLILLVLIVGIAGGVYLSQNQQIFRSRADYQAQSSLLAVSPSSVKQGEEYQVSWVNVPSESKFDLVAVYRKSDPDSSLSQLSFNTSSCSESVGRKALKSGKCKLVATSKLSAGEYELRFFSGGELNNRIAVAGLTISGGSSQPTQTPSPTSSLPPISYGTPKEGMESKCENGDLTFKWKQLDPEALGYLLRVDRDPDSWSGSYSSINQGDYLFDKLINGNYGTSGLVTNIGFAGVRGHIYKWWLHPKYEDGPYDSGGMDGMYKGRFGPLIDGGYVTCH